MKKKYTILSITAIIACIVFVSALWTNSSNASENKPNEELTGVLNRDYSYIDSYPPDFYGEGRQSGELLLKFVDNTGDSEIRYKLFSTEDVGKSWTAE